MKRHGIILELAIVLPELLGWSGAEARGQEKLCDWSVAQDRWAEYDDFGYAAVGAGDLDGDGVPDAVVAAPWEDPITGGVELGVTYLISGATGSILQQWTGSGDRRLFGWTVSTPGDLDGDGVTDILAGEPALFVSGPGKVYAYSGASGASLFELTAASNVYAFGVCLSPLGDVDADGVPDFGVGAEWNGPGRVYIYSGKTQSAIYTFKGQSANAATYMVRGLGDLDSDGHADFGIGSAGDGPNAEGTFKIFSGASRGLLFSFQGEVTGSAFGYQAASLGDTDGDGKPDFAVGSIGYSGTFVDEGRVYVYSGASGALLWTFDGSMYNEKLGLVLSSNGAIDFNHDGFADIPVGSPARNAAFIYSGRSGTLLYEIRGSAPGGRTETMGNAISAIGDLNGDGIDDMLIGAETNSDPWTWAGRAYVFGGNDLFLQANQLSYVPNDAFSLENRGGTPGAATCIVLTAVNSTPTFLPVAFGSLDNDGNFALKGSVPMGLSGISLTFMGYAIASSGHGVADSIPETVTFQ